MGPRFWQVALVVTAAGALPDGTSLTIGAGGTLRIRPEPIGVECNDCGSCCVRAWSAAASGTSAPIAVAGALANGPVDASTLSTFLPLLERQVKNLSHVSATMSTVANDAVFASHRSALDRTDSSPDTPQSARAVGMARGDRKFLEFLGSEQDDRFDSRGPGQGSCPVRTLTELR